MSNIDISATTTAKRVLMIKAHVTREMAEHLPDDFGVVVEKILQSVGRVIVSGVGKSGHIGNKIASTLASTGTPRYFVYGTKPLPNVCSAAV